ncbi:MAG: protein translocase subunit SecF, partial [Candidatus Sungbacteria bacterium]|nr:protein translocase subunit SecF [Candidatus Sungbacteria bacterium]
MDFHMNIVAHRKIFYLLSGLLILTSVIAVSIWGLKFGIDFTGGSILEVEFENNRPAVAELNERARTLNLGDVRFQPSGKNALLVRTSHLSEEKHQALLGAIAGDKSSGVSEKRFDAVGPVIGRELQRKSAVAVVLVILLIVSYIAFAFRKVSEPVASWKYGLTTVAALLHDVVIPVGFFALGGYFWGFEVDTLFVT